MSHETLDSQSRWGACFLPHWETCLSKWSLTKGTHIRLYTAWERRSLTADVLRVLGKGAPAAPNSLRPNRGVGADYSLPSTCTEAGLLL